MPKGNLSQLEQSRIPDVDLAGVSTIKEASGIIF
jgi:hypothetical protein